MRAAFVAALLVALPGCATAQQSPVPAIGASPLCAPGVSLGKVVIAPLTRWRADQKEPQVREAIAQKAIEAVAPALSCAASVEVLSIAADAQAAESIAAAKAAAAQTALLIRINELGPVTIISFPALWSTYSDVQFTLDAIDVTTGETLRSIPHQRRKGGAFEVRGLDPLQGEMEQALKDVLLGGN